MNPRLLVLLSRTVVVALAVGGMIMLILNVFLPLDPLQRAYDRFIGRARRRPFIRRGLRP